MSYAVVCAPFSILCTSKKFASPASTMGLAIDRPPYSTLLATRFLATLTITMGNATP